MTNKSLLLFLFFFTSKCFSQEYILSRLKAFNNHQNVTIIQDELKIKQKKIDSLYMELLKLNSNAINYQKIIPSDQNSDRPLDIFNLNKNLLYFDAFADDPNYIFRNLTSRFPIPPYKASSSIRIPDSCLANLSKQNQIDSILKRKLALAGIYTYAYYQLPENYSGFAIALSLEEFSKPDGLSKRIIESKNNKNIFWDFINYFSRLFSEEKGYYRVITFIVTNMPFSNNGEGISLSIANDFLDNGTNARINFNGNNSIDNQSNYNCFCYIYEFVKTENKKDPICSERPILAPTVHLKALKLFNIN